MKYRKKPVEIEAIEWTGHNHNEIRDFCGEGASLVETGGIHSLSIHTLEGTMHASVGDYIIKGVRGELYPCKPDIFKQTYDPIS